MPVKITGVTTAYKGWGQYLIASVQLPDGQVIKREVEDHGNAAAILPYDAERRKALLVKQFRTPMLYAGGVLHSLEAIAGRVDEGEPADTARREAMEEAGLRITTLEPVVTSWSMPGVSTERISLYLASYSAEDRIAAGGGLAEEHEDIEVLEFDLTELAAMADRGELEDMKTFALLQTLRLRRPDLFA